MIKNELMSAAAYQLSLDYDCRPDDFFEMLNKVTVSKALKGRRIVGGVPDFFKMASFGFGAVASVSPEIFAFTREMMSKFESLESAELFSDGQLYVINKELAKHNKTIGINKIFYLPKTPFKYLPKSGFNIKIYKEPQIRDKLYRYEGFQNALLYNLETASRRDVLSSCSFNRGNIAGIAGASSDSDMFWQIGIDVASEYRNKGLAADLVSALTQEVLKMGVIPYYGTWGGNIASQKLALKCGFYPVWTEVIALDC